MWITGPHGELRGERQRRRETHAGPYTSARCLLIGRHDALSAALQLGNRKNLWRCVRLENASFLLELRQRFEREPRQMRPDP
jgi:hypothetical protein